MEDLQDARFIMNRAITRTTSVVQNYRVDGSFEAVQDTDKYQYITKSLTDIERERIVAAKENSRRLRKYQPSLQTMELDYD